MGLTSMTVCFVCGSVGAENTLHIKPREKGAYFPFLEHHDPPKGTRLPGPDGVVASCRVCYSFLKQQWDSFERTKTPAIKRLYWLKRTDNGTFTGAEMRIQGEYAAQVMGLQYTPGTAGFGVSGPGYSDFGGSQSNLSAASPGSFGYGSPAKLKVEAESANGALDLSMAAPKPKIRLEKGVHETKSVVCFTCVVEHPANHCRYVASRRTSNGDAYFPFLERMDPPRGGQPLNSQGLARVCRSCYATLHRQWKGYNGSKVPEEERVYKINDEPLPIFFEKTKREHELSGPEYMEFQEICYLCSQVYHKDSMKLLYTRPPDVSSKHSMYFPFIATLQRPPKTREMDGEGRVLSCRACYSYLQRQWQTYQAEGVPLHNREFLLRPLSSCGGKSTPASSPVATSPLPPKSGMNQPLKIQISQTSSNDVTTSPGLLAIASGIPPHMATANTANYYQGVAAVPTTAVQQPVVSTIVSTLSTVPKQEKPCTETSGQQLPSNSVFCFVCGYKCTGGKFYTLKLYLNSKQSMKEGNPEPFFPFLGDREPAANANQVAEDGSVQSCRYCYFSLIRQWHEYERVGGTNRWTRKYNVKTFICYVCATEESRSKVRTIGVHRFPFVKDLRPPEKATIVEDTVSVVVCGRCEGHLYAQHLDYEKRGIPPGERSYSVAGLQAAVLPTGEKVQSKDEEERTRNDSADEKPPQLHPQPQQQHQEGDGEERQDPEGAAPQEQGLNQGSKPPPLTMVSPAGKMTRTTATVPPLSQVSPSSAITSIGNNAAMNATRTSSFAAALRKLAKQAGDPIDPATIGREGIRETSPAATSPRTPTPKRALPPSGAPYNHSLNQNTNIVNSPPVVTIAPTTLHSSHVVSDDINKNVDRGSLQNSTGPMIEPPGIKQERDRMAPSLGSHERRDDDHPHKDRTTPKMSSHSVITSASTSREEPSARGFQPYRPGDESRGAPHLPPHAFAALDPAYSAAAYHSAAAAAAFMPPHAFTHPAFRFDDPLLMERYRMMQPPAFMPYAHHPGMLPPGLSPLLSQGARYPAELLGHQYPLISPSAKMPDHRSPVSDRDKNEEERRREEERERERERQREMEREREREQRERERRQQEERERMEQEKLERERRERERIERERAERERERRNQEQRQRESEMMSRVQSAPGLHNDEQGHYKTGVFPNYPPGKAEDMAKWHRDQHNLMQKKEFDRRLMHQQFLMEQDMYATMQKERERRHAVEKSEHERSGPPPLALNKSHGEEHHNNFHRPFENLANGFESSHYERKSILAQDRQIMQDHQRQQVARSHQPQDLRTVDHNHGDLHVTSHNNHHHGDIDRRFGDKSYQSSHHAPVNSKPTLITPQFTPTSQRHENVPSQPREVLNNCHRKTTEEVEKREPWSNHDVGLKKEPVSVTSKLDVEEERLRKARQNDRYNSDSESEIEDDLIKDEERKRQRCMLIASGPALQLDRSPAKMKYLKQFKLTTREKRGDMDFQRRRKRRKIYREPSVSPVEIEERERNSPLQYPSPIHPDSLNREHGYKHKVHFLRELKLQAVPPEKRREMDVIRLACELDKQRRNGVTNCVTLPHYNHNRHPEMSLLAGMKRKHQEVDNSNGHIDSQQFITLSQLQERHLLNSRPTNDLRNSGSSAEYTRERKDSEVSVGSSLDERPKMRSLTREFAQEFHESVLATTRQQVEMKGQSITNRVGGREIDIRYHPTEERGTPSKPEPRPNSTSSDTPGGSTDKRVRTEPSVMKWPGIEAVIEAYQKYDEEQNLEKQILLDRCHHLQSQNYEHHRTAERSSIRMRDLLQNKEALNKDRIQIQASIDSLKKCLKLFR